MTRPTCATCRAFDRFSDTDGRCKAALPIYSDRWGSIWPQVRETEWCMHRVPIDTQLDPDKLPGVMG